MKDELKMGLRSLAYRRKQYVSLFLVCMFGVAISLFSLFLIKGMLKSLQDKAKIYYGGDFQLLGQRSDLVQNGFGEKKSLLLEVFPKGTIITPRYDLDAKSSAYYFEGTGVRQRVIKGVDFITEEKLFKNFNYVEGSADEIANTNGVLLSSPIAQMLEVHVGDEITFMLKTRDGVVNTVPLIVKGIFIDSSLFGMYTSYVDLNYLLKAYNVSDDSFNRLCISVPKGKATVSEVKVFQKALEEKLPMYPLVKDKQRFYDARTSIKMPCYALIQLSANLDDIQILIDAMGLIATFIIVMLIIIIVAGVSSTFRVIVMKRINEIGIYKAIGMRRGKIMGMLLTETLLLIVSGCVAGFLLSLILCALLKIFNFSFIPAFDIFLSNGKLVPIISPGYICLITGIVIVTTLVAVLFSVKKSVSVTPCQALAVAE